MDNEFFSADYSAILFTAFDGIDSLGQFRSRNDGFFGMGEWNDGHQSAFHIADAHMTVFFLVPTHGDLVACGVGGQ